MDQTMTELRATKQRVLNKFPNIDASKLVTYRYVDDLSDLLEGRYIRWIHVSNPEKLYTGGFVARVDIDESGIHILCTNRGKMFQLIFDECIVFQKITSQEFIIFKANEF